MLRHFINCYSTSIHYSNFEKTIDTYASTETGGKKGKKDLLTKLSWLIGPQHLLVIFLFHDDLIRNYRNGIVGW